MVDKVFGKPSSPAKQQARRAPPTTTVKPIRTRSLSPPSARERVQYESPISYHTVEYVPEPPKPKPKPKKKKAQADVEQMAAEAPPGIGFVAEFSPYNEISDRFIRSRDGKKIMEIIGNLEDEDGKEYELSQAYRQRNELYDEFVQKKYPDEYARLLGKRVIEMQKQPAKTAVEQFAQSFRPERELTVSTQEMEEAQPKELREMSQGDLIKSFLGYIEQVREGQTQQFQRAITDVSKESQKKLEKLIELQQRKTRRKITPQEIRELARNNPELAQTIVYNLQRDLLGPIHIDPSEYEDEEDDYKMEEKRRQLEENARRQIEADYLNLKSALPKERRYAVKKADGSIVFMTR